MQKINILKYGMYVIAAISILFFEGCRCLGYSEITVQETFERIVLTSSDTIKLHIEHLEQSSGGYRTTVFNKGTTRFRSTDYIIRFNLKVNDRPLSKAIYEIEADTDESIEEYKTYLNFKFSIDKKHLLIKSRRKAVGILHFLPVGPPFASVSEKKDIKSLSKKFKSNTLPDPFNIIINYIAKTKSHIVTDNDEFIKKTLTAQPSGTILDEALLDYLGKPIADAFYETDKRGDNLAAENKKWRNTAILKVNKYIDNGATNEDMGLGAVKLYKNSLQKYISKKDFDKKVLPFYPLYLYTTEYYSVDEERKISEEYLKKMHANSLKILKPKSNNDDKNLRIRRQKITKEAIAFLIEKRTKNNLPDLEKVVAKCFQKHIVDLDTENLDKFLDERLKTKNKFSEKEKAIVIKYAKKLYDSLPEDDYPTFRMRIHIYLEINKEH